MPIYRVVLDSVFGEGGPVGGAEFGDWQRLQIAALEIGHEGEFLDIADRHLLVLDRDQVLVGEPAQRAVDIGEAEAERVADDFLAERQLERVFVGQADRLQPGQEFEQEMCDSLMRRPAADDDQVLGMDRRVARERPEDLGGEPRMRLEQPDQLFQRHHRQPWRWSAP